MHTLTLTYIHTYIHTGGLFCSERGLRSAQGGAARFEFKSLQEDYPPHENVKKIKILKFKSLQDCFTRLTNIRKYLNIWIQTFKSSGVWLFLHATRKFEYTLAFEFKHSKSVLFDDCYTPHENMRKKWIGFDQDVPVVVAHAHAYLFKTISRPLTPFLVTFQSPTTLTTAQWFSTLAFHAGISLFMSVLLSQTGCGHHPVPAGGHIAVIHSSTNPQVTLPKVWEKAMYVK